MADVQKSAEQVEQKTAQKTPEAAKEGGVIAAQPSQEVHGQAFANAHQNDKTLSEPDMIAMNDGETVAEYTARVAQIQSNRFGFFDSEKEKPKVYEKQAGQAVEAPPSVKLNDPDFQSSVKLNVQITNVPEVSAGVKPEELLQYTDTMMQSGAKVVGPVKEYMAQPNAVTDSLLQIGPALDNTVNYFANTPADKVAEDVQAIVGITGDAIDGSLGHAMTPEERAEAAGSIMPMFFFEGNAKEPINPQTVEQMGLEGMTEAELKALGIEKRVEKVSAIEAENMHTGKIPKDVESGEIASQEVFQVEIEPKPQSLTAVQARDWYNAKVNQIDAVEQQMRLEGKTSKEIFETTTNLRNEAKLKARELMEDQETAQSLPPLPTADEVLEKYHGDYEEAIKASKRTNKGVNRKIEIMRRKEDEP